MYYDAKLEPPKFNPDLASLNSSNNCIVSSGSSVTLTPVSSFSSTSEKSFSNHDSSKSERFFNSEHKSKEEKKTPNVVVKIGKHGETYHAKKEESDRDSSTKEATKEKENSHDTSPAVEKVPNNLIKFDKGETEKRNSLEIKEEAGEKKGFTTANFTESFVTQSVSVTAALIKSDKEASPPRKPASEVTSIKVESIDVDSKATPTGTTNSSVSKSRPSVKDSNSVLDVLSKPKSEVANSSNENIPHTKNNKDNSSPSPYSYDNNNPLKNSSSNVFARGNLGTSVSLFPTNSTSSNHKVHTEPVTLNSVSIIPTVTSSAVSSSSTKNDSSSKSSITPLTQPVTISPVNSSEKSSERLSLESPNQQKSATSPRSGNGVKRLGRPPKKGTHVATNSLGSTFSGLEEAGEPPVVKRLKTEDKADTPEEKNDTKDLHRLMMFGATLNPTSGMAKEMTSVLQVCFQSF